MAEAGGELDPAERPDDEWPFADSDDDSEMPGYEEEGRVTSGANGMQSQNPLLVNPPLAGDVGEPVLDDVFAHDDKSVANRSLP